MVSLLAYNNLIAYDRLQVCQHEATDRAYRLTIDLRAYENSTVQIAKCRSWDVFYCRLHRYSNMILKKRVTRSIEVFG